MWDASRGSTSCGWQVFNATGAGLCFLVAALGVAGVLTGIAEFREEPRPTDPPLIGTALICLVVLGGAVAFAVLGLRLAGDFVPPLASRPLRYAATALMIPVLGALAIPLLPVTVLAGSIVAVAGPLVDWFMTRRCFACAMARKQSLGLDPAFCAQHDRFFGGDAYRALLSRDVD